MRRIACVVLLLAGCMPAAYREARKLEGSFKVAAPGEGWKAVDPGGADRAWFNASLGASAYVDSNCGPRFRDLRIEDLATELVAGLRDAELVREEPLTMAGRAALMRVTRGSLDGVTVQVGATVLNRAPCTYDFVVIAPPEGFDRAMVGYERMLGGFGAP